MNKRVAIGIAGCVLLALPVNSAPANAATGSVWHHMSSSTSRVTVKIDWRYSTVEKFNLDVCATAIDRKKDSKAIALTVRSLSTSEESKIYTVNAATTAKVCFTTANWPYVVSAEGKIARSGDSYSQLIVWQREIDG